MSSAVCVALCTASPLKTQACRDALERCFGNGFTILNIAGARSGVPEQPVGRAQIVSGASNRLQAASEHPVALSIESGVIAKRSLFYETTCIMFKARGRTFTKWTEPFEIPERLASAWLEQRTSLRNHDLTIGEVAHSQDNSTNPSDWYVSCGHDTSRQDMIRETIVDILLRESITRGPRRPRTEDSALAA